MTGVKTKTEELITLLAELVPPYTLAGPLQQWRFRVPGSEEDLLHRSASTLLAACSRALVEVPAERFFSLLEEHEKAQALKGESETTTRQ